MRALLAAGLLAVGVACTPPGQASTPTGPGPTGSASASDSAAAIDATEIIVRDFTLDPIDVTATAGGVTLAVTNEGPTVHNVAIRDDAGELLGTTRVLRSGESEEISPEIPAGSYVLFCSLPGHESLGIRGTLDVAP